MEIGTYIENGSSHFAVVYDSKIYYSNGIIDKTESSQFFKFHENELTEQVITQATRMIAINHPVFSYLIDMIDRITDSNIKIANKVSEMDTSIKLLANDVNNSIVDLTRIVRALPKEK